MFLTVSVNLLVFAAREEDLKRNRTTTLLNLAVTIRFMGCFFLMASCNWVLHCIGGVLALLSVKRGEPVGEAEPRYHTVELALSASSLVLWVASGLSLCLAPRLRQPSIADEFTAVEGLPVVHAGAWGASPAAHVARVRRTMSTFLILDGVLGLAFAGVRYTLGNLALAEVRFALGLLDPLAELATGTAAAVVPAAWAAYGRSAIAHLAGLAKGDWAWLAPLHAGIARDGADAEVRTAIEEVMRNTAAAAVTLDPSSVESIAKALRTALPGRKRLWQGEASSRTPGRASGNAAAILPALAPDAPQEPQPHPGGRSADGNPHRGVPEHAMRRSASTPADWFVVVAPDEDPEQCAQALGRLALSFDQVHGRPPRAWIDVLRPLQAPAAPLLRMAACDKCVVLVGPHFTDHLLCAVHTFLWLKLGRGHAQMLVEPLVPWEAIGAGLRPGHAGEGLVSRLDTFHAMYSHVGTRGRPEDVHGLAQAATLLDLERVNEAVSSLLPSLQEALRRLLANDSLA